MVAKNKTTNEIIKNNTSLNEIKRGAAEDF